MWKFELPSRCYTTIRYSRTLLGGFCTALYALAFIAIVSCTTQPQPLAENGIIDLSSYDFSSRGPVKLDGMWEFHWGKLLEPVDFANRMAGEPSYVHVPDTWDRHAIDGTNLPGVGHATFRLKIILPSGLNHFGLKIQEASSAYRLFVNGVLVASNGKVGTHRESSVPQFLPKTAQFSAENGESEIILQISNYHEKNGGPWHSMYLGLPEQIAKLREFRVFIEAALIGILLVIGIYHLGLFIIRPKELSSFYFFLYCIIIALRTALMGERLLVFFFPNFPWETGVRLEHITFYMSVPLFSYFLTSLYPAEIHRYFSRALLAAGIIAAAAVFATPALVFTHLVTPFQIITMIALLYWVYGIILSIVRREEDSILVFAGFIVISATAVNDMLYARGAINTGYMISIGLLILIFVLSFTISLRFSRSFKRTEELSEELRHSKKQIEEYNLTLEQKILERSAKIIEQNAFFEMQVDMAGKLQRSLLPSAPPQIPEVNIATLYLPSMGVGGDIYDFRMNSSDGLGMFIADVSGHGIAAALIASMLKMSLNRWDEHMKQPSSLFKEIHAALSDKIGNNFVSACACYIDFRQRMMRAAIAGHPSPVIINANGTFRQGEHRGHVISHLFSSNFSDFEISLEPGDKIILYTDGIIEARNARGELFGEKRFFNILTEQSHLSPQKLCERIHQEVLSHSKEQQEDDITMVIAQYGQ